MAELNFKDPHVEGNKVQKQPDPKPGNYCAARDGFLRATSIQNVTQLIDYVKRKLGAPRICVEIDDVF